MAVPFSNSRLRIPHGFQGLLEGMAKQVLLMQPPDIYAFSATYFEDLLKKRDGMMKVLCLSHDAMLARYMPSSCVCLCICLSHSGLVSKRLNIGSCK